MVRVHRDEGIANRIGPESCDTIREGCGEASIGECTGQPLSRERSHFRAPTPFRWRKATRSGAPARVSERPGVVEDPGMCRRSLRGNREASRLTSGTGP
jgi:hypothetical protein